MLEAKECRALAMDVQEGRVYEEEFERFLYNIEVVIKDYAKNGAFKVGLAYNHEIDGGVGVYKINIPLYVSVEGAKLFLGNIFKDIKSELQLRGFVVYRLEYSLLHNINHHQCNYSIVVEW